MNINDEQILAGVLDEFAALAAIPRPSGHEKAVSDYLLNHLTACGFSTVQDEANNIIADKAAAPGYQNAPRTILQAHMDMVAVAKTGVAFDPLRDPIKLVRDGEYLRADGTSLGADDGIGVACGIYALKNFTAHGPLRLIITTDEERGMTGAQYLDAKYVADASYLINCDSENFEELIVGSAGGVDINFTRKINWFLSKKNAAYTVKVTGLKGGHSGERIGDGRGNALHILAAMLLSANTIAGIELASFNGGKAKNVIAANAEAVITSDAKEQTLRYIAQVVADKFRQIHGDADPDIEITVTPAEKPTDVFGEEDAQNLLRLLYLLPKGVLGMSRVVPNLVESSANLGVVVTKDKEVTVDFYPRSSVDARLNEFANAAKELAALTGFVADCQEPSPAWHENKNSRLAPLMRQIFLAQNGKEPKITVIHAGLECGYFYRKNPQLDIVSVGVTTQDIHSPNERLLLSTVTPQVKLIEATLAEIAATHSNYSKQL